MKITFFSALEYDVTSFNQLNKDFGFELEYKTERLSPETAKSITNTDAVCAFVNDNLGADTIAVLKEKGVKFIVMRCAGFNMVDIKAATAAGIKIGRVPAYSPEAVGEFTVGLLLTLIRKIHVGYNRTTKYNFSLVGLEGFNINGKTVAVFGTGKTGVAFARIIKAFGCKLIGYDAYQNDDFKAIGGEYVSKEEAFAQADVISLHLPLIEGEGGTHHIINKDSIAQMKEGVVILNAGRGGLVNTIDTIAGLKSGKVKALGTDVYENEMDYFFADKSGEPMTDKVLAELLSLPNVIVTGHQAYLTDTALNQIAHVTLTNAKNLEAGNALTFDGAALN